MSKPRRVYWDTSCFICFLNHAEEDRRLTCQDVLLHTQRKEIEIWTSTFTIAEVIRPRRMQPKIPPLPDWATQPKTCKDPAIEALFKRSENRIQELWDYYHKNTAPYERLKAKQINMIAGMFEWKWIQKVLVDERTANKAVEIARDYDLKPADAIHAASALLKKVDACSGGTRTTTK